MTNRCKQCGKVTTDAWCDTCSTDVMVLLQRSLAKAEHDRRQKAMAHKNRVAEARAQGRGW